jgi:hypothetical protein
MVVRVHCSTSWAVCSACFGYLVTECISRAAPGFEPEVGNPISA